MLRAVLIFLLVMLLVGGGIGGYLAYDRLVLAKQQEPVVVVEEEPPVDPSIEAWESLLPSLGENPSQDLAALQNFLALHPETPLRESVFDRLNEAMSVYLFTPVPAQWKEPYSVVSGDSLDRISRTSGAPADWILKMNNLLSHDLRIGQQLLLPKIDVKVVLSTSENRLFLFQEDRLIGALPVEIPTGSVFQPGEGQVTDRLASKDGRAVAVATKDFPGADKTVSVSLPGVSFAAKPDPMPGGETPATPSGILLSKPDMEEFFSIVKRGTPVATQ